MTIPTFVISHNTAWFDVYDDANRDWRLVDNEEEESFGKKFVSGNKTLYIDVKPIDLEFYFAKILAHKDSEPTIESVLGLRDDPNPINQAVRRCLDLIEGDADKDHELPLTITRDYQTLSVDYRDKEFKVIFDDGSGPEQVFQSHRADRPFFKAKRYNEVVCNGAADARKLNDSLFCYVYKGNIIYITVRLEADDYIAHMRAFTSISFRDESINLPAKTYEKNISRINQSLYQLTRRVMLDTESVIDSIGDKNHAKG